MLNALLIAKLTTKSQVPTVYLQGDLVGSTFWLADKLMWLSDGKETAFSSCLFNMMVAANCSKLVLRCNFSKLSQGIKIRKRLSATNKEANMEKSPNHYDYTICWNSGLFYCSSLHR